MKDKELDTKFQKVVNNFKELDATYRATKDKRRRTALDHVAVHLMKDLRRLMQALQIIIKP
jgi:hypothetical protein